MAVYWSSSLFAFLWTEAESRSVKTQKENEASPVILTELAWSIKDLLRKWFKPKSNIPKLGDWSPVKDCC